MSHPLGEVVGKMAEGLSSFLSLAAIAFIVCIFSVPLAIWKLVDIAIWLYHHFHLNAYVS